MDNIHDIGLVRMLSFDSRIEGFDCDGELLFVMALPHHYQSAQMYIATVKAPAPNDEDAEVMNSWPLEPGYMTADNTISALYTRTALELTYADDFDGAGMTKRDFTITIYWREDLVEFVQMITAGV